MALFSPSSMPLLVVLLVVVAGLHSVRAETAEISFINVADESIKLLPASKDANDLDPYQETVIATSLGETIVYDYQGMKHSVLVKESNQVHVIGPDTVHVECSTSEGPFRAVIKPRWSPRGAARFLELVEKGYYNGCALNRVVKAFLTQFGISADYNMRTFFRTKSIQDDTPQKIPFQPGYMSYAGSGPNSRTAEVFIVMSNTSPHQLEYFGTNPWETPFGYVEDLSTVDKWEASYGDMAPWGNGPDPQLIYQKDGYEYLKEKFPRLSYLQECKIVNVETEPEEEL